MTELRARSGGLQEQPGARGRNSYREVLRRPGALRFSVAAFIGRMPMSMFGLGTVLLISSATGRYGLAGAVAAAGAVAYAVCGPLAAILTDRLGQRRVLRPQAAVFGISVIAFVACAQLRSPLWALLASGAAAGAAMPSLGSMVRARWSAVLAEPHQLHTAFALESVADEMIFVIGPALVTVLATEVHPAAGVVVAGLLCVTGTLLLAAQRGTQPAPRPRVGVAAATPAARPADGAAHRLRWSAHRGLRLRLPARGLVTLAPVFLFLGSMFATIDLSTVAFAQEHGHKPLAGFILGTYALGSATGGLWYGSRRWRAALERRFAVTLCATVAGVAALWAMPGLLALTVMIFVSGLAIAPTLMAGFGLLERQAPAARRTEALAWLSSTISVGVAAGSAAAGRVIDSGGARAGYLLAAGSGMMAVLVCVAGLRRLRPAAGAGPAEEAAGAQAAEEAAGASPAE